jgi:ATP-dependent Clp protease ATP-binding subunit ClpA
MFERYTEKARRVIFFARYEASQFGGSCIETEHLLLGLLREDHDLALHFLGSEVTDAAIPGAMPPEIEEIEKRIEYIVHRMENAIANQEFEKAQFYSHEERKERENLRQLREKYNLRSASEAHEGGIMAGIRRQIEAQTTRGEKVSTSVDLPLSHESKRVLTYGAEEAERLSHKHISTEHLLLGLLREEKCFAADILHERGLRLPLVRKEIARSRHPEPGQAGVRFDRAGRGPGLGLRTAQFAGQAGFWKLAMQDGGRVLHLARREAAQRNSPCVETTDLLLALLIEKEVAERFPGLAEAVREHKKPEQGAQREKVSAFELPFSEDCKFACTFATEEAAQLGQRTGPGHLLLGILRVESCAAAEILRDCGFTEAGIRAQLKPPPPPSDPEQGRSYV